jgi:large exoprotein involved in heme utilization and adhesion
VSALPQVAELERGLLAKMQQLSVLEQQNQWLQVSSALVALRGAGPQPCPPQAQRSAQPFTAAAQAKNEALDLVVKTSDFVLLVNQQLPVDPGQAAHKPGVFVEVARSVGLDTARLKAAAKVWDASSPSPSASTSASASGCSAVSDRKGSGASEGVQHGVQEAGGAADANQQVQRLYVGMVQELRLLLNQHGVASPEGEP